MNNSEKKGCTSILKKLDQGDLMSLTDTVTKKQIIAKSRQEAIKIIVCYSQNSSELLKRKKIRRDVLFQYLIENKITVSTTAEKHQLIGRCLEFWGSDVNQNSLVFESDDEVPATQRKSATSTSLTIQPAPARRSNIQVSQPIEPALRTGTNIQSSIAIQPTPEINPNHQQTSVSFHFTTEVNPNEQRFVSVQLATQTNSNQQTRLDYSHQIGSAQASTSNATRNSEQQSLGETFATWFYKILNSHNPTAGQSPEDFGPHHFWNDVTLQLQSVSPQPASDSYEGCDLVSQRLLALVKEEMLLFNPNIGSNGISVKTDPHGLTFVLVCGTLHRHSDCLGVFQQAFGLVRDPRYENNWKIKNTKLRLLSGKVISMPRLEDLPLIEDQIQ